MTRDVVDQSYEVGRGKPPAHTRFKPGQSGNPRGRPRGSFDLRQALLESVSEFVVVTDNGRKRKVTKAKVAATQLANKAASGDARAIDLLYKHLGPTAAVAPATPPAENRAESSFGTEEDKQVLALMLDRVRREGSS